LTNKRASHDPARSTRDPKPRGPLQVSQANPFFTIKREIKSRSSEKEENDIQAEISSLKKSRLEDIDIVRVLLVKDPSNHYRKQPLQGSQNIVSVAKNFLAGEDREVFIAVNLDQTLKINSIHVVSIGTVNMSLVHPREVFKTAILSNASHIVLAHNHPSGNPEPSDEDIRMTSRLFQCGELLGIKVVDHIIIGDSE
jgi:DNA repair protein RadC